MTSSTRFRTNSPTVVHLAIDNEVVILNVVSGTYYSLEQTGADIWGLIEQGARVGDVTAHLAGKYDQNPS